MRWGGFPQLKEIDDEESRRRYIKEVVVEKILRYDLPARFGGENPIDLEMLYGVYASEYGQIVEYNTLARDVGVSVGRLKRLTEALMAGYLVQYCFNYTRSKRKSGRTGKKVYLSTPSLAAHRYGPLDTFPEILGKIVENDVFLRLREMDEALFQTHLSCVCRPLCYREKELPNFYVCVGTSTFKLGFWGRIES